MKHTLNKVITLIVCKTTVVFMHHIVSLTSQCKQIQDQSPFLIKKSYMLLLQYWLPLGVGGALFSGTGPLLPSLAIDTGLVLVLLLDPCPLSNGTSAHSKKSHCSFSGLGQV